MKRRPGFYMSSIGSFVIVHPDGDLEWMIPGGTWIKRGIKYYSSDTTQIELRKIFVRKMKTLKLLEKL